MIGCDLIIKSWWDRSQSYGCDLNQSHRASRKSDQIWSATSPYQSSPIKLIFLRSVEKPPSRVITKGTVGLPPSQPLGFHEKYLCITLVKQLSNVLPNARLPNSCPPRPTSYIQLFDNGNTYEHLWPHAKHILQQSFPRQKGAHIVPGGQQPSFSIGVTVSVLFTVVDCSTLTPSPVAARVLAPKPIVDCSGVVGALLNSSLMSCVPLCI